MLVAAGNFREQMTDAGANMHGGAFPAQGQAAADGQNTPDKLDRGNAGRVTRPPLFQSVFDMRNRRCHRTLVRSEQPSKRRRRRQVQRQLE